MTWVFWLFYDAFACLGFMLFLGVVYVITFNDGQISGVSTGWFVMVPLLYSWLVGEFYRWPQEDKNDE